MLTLGHAMAYLLSPVNALSPAKSKFIPHEKRSIEDAPSEITQFFFTPSRSQFSSKPPQRYSKDQMTLTAVFNGGLHEIGFQMHPPLSGPPRGVDRSFPAESPGTQSLRKGKWWTETVTNVPVERTVRSSF